MSRRRPLDRGEYDELSSFVAELEPDDWGRPSLCAGWTVADVVAHVAAWERVLAFDSPAQYLPRLVRFGVGFLGAGLSIDRFNERIAARAPAPASMLRVPSSAHHLFERVAPGSQLAELVVHHQDIRRPLGRPRAIPPDRLRAALDGLRFLPGVNVRARFRSLRWHAEDVDWAAGRGPTVAGSGEAILLTLAGRTAAVGELHGDGVARLAP